MEGNLFEPLELFLEICKIPHPSNHGIELKKWLIQKAREFGAEVQEDSAGNLLCSKGVQKFVCKGIMIWFMSEILRILRLSRL